MLQMPFVSTSASEPFDEQVIEAEVLERELIDQGVFRNLLRHSGRELAMPVVAGLELLLDHQTPAQVRITMLAALNYFVLPADLIPDVPPISGLSDD